MKKYLGLLFGLLFSFNLFSQTVYITKTGEKYHRGTCHYLSKSKIPVELSDAINRGYDPCKVCKPPQSTNSVSKEEKVKETPANYNNNNSTSSQCIATTKKGTRCKRMTISSNGKCWQHGGD